MNKIALVVLVLLFSLLGTLQASAQDDEEIIYLPLVYSGPPEYILVTVVDTTRDDVLARGGIAWFLEDGGDQRYMETRNLGDPAIWSLRVRKVNWTWRLWFLHPSFACTNEIHRLRDDLNYISGCCGNLGWGGKIDCEKDFSQSSDSRGE